RAEAFRAAGRGRAVRRPAHGDLRVLAGPRRADRVWNRPPSRGTAWLFRAAASGPLMSEPPPADSSLDRLASAAGAVDRVHGGRSIGEPRLGPDDLAFAKFVCLRAAPLHLDALIPGHKSPAGHADNELP